MLGALTDEFVFLLRQSVVFLCFQVVLLGNEFILIECLLLLVSAAQAFYLGAIFQHVLAHVELLLLHLDLRIAQDVLLLCQFGFGVQDGEV